MTTVTVTLCLFAALFMVLLVGIPAFWLLAWRIKIARGTAVPVSIQEYAALLNGVPGIALTKSLWWPRRFRVGHTSFFVNPREERIALSLNKINKIPLQLGDESRKVLIREYTRKLSKQERIVVGLIEVKDDH